jgi:hypothetical protein
MTKWNDFVADFAEKKNIAYGCAIVRNDLRKAYAKKYDPVPRNRGIYTTRNEDGTIKQMGRGQRKEGKIRPPEAVQASKLKRRATYEKKADDKAEREKKEQEERQAKFWADLEERENARKKREAEEKDKARIEKETREAKLRADKEEYETKKKEQEAWKAEVKAKEDARNQRILDNAKTYQYGSNEPLRVYGEGYSGKGIPIDSRYTDVGYLGEALRYWLGGGLSKRTIIDKQWKNGERRVFQGDISQTPDTWERIGTLKKDRSFNITLDFTDEYKATRQYKQYLEVVALREKQDREDPPSQAELDKRK